MSSLWTKFKDIKQINMINVPGGLTYKQVKIHYPEADIISSLTMFVLSSSINFIRFEDENVKDGYLGASEGIGIKGKKDLVWAFHKEAYESDEIRDFCSGFPTILKDSKEYIYWGPKYSKYVDGKHKRVLIGFNKDLIIIVATDNAVYLSDAKAKAHGDKQSASSIMRSFGCTHAMAGDGGLWSPHLQKHAKIYRKGYRKNSTWMLVYLDKRKEFIKLALSTLGWGYVFGAQGEILTKKLLKKLVRWFGKSHYYFNGYSAKKWYGKKVADCSGDFIYILRTLGLIPMTADYTARGIYANLCYNIDKSELQDGDLVFRGSPIRHVGMYYKGDVLHSKGTKYGVVITDELNTFNRYGRIKSLD